MRGIIATLLALFCGTALADTTFTFTEASDYSCVNYCTGYFSSDPAHTVDFVNVTVGAVVWTGAAWAQTYKFTVSVDGVYYAGSGFNGQPFVAGTGTFVVNFTTKTTCTHSGRGQHCTTWRSATDGTVTLQ